MSQLLSRIDSRLQQETDDYVIAELQAKKAAYLVRIGESDTARSIVADVRRTFGDGRSGRVTCFLQLAEGLLHYYEFDGATARDKFTRALFLAEAMREPDLIALCAAWKAFIDFYACRFEAMHRSLVLVRDSVGSEDHAVLSRRAVVMMTAAIILGDKNSAQRWFQVGHRHAVADGDQACIDALLFGRGVFGVARQRIDWCRDSTDSEWLGLIRAELGSAKNLQQLVGISTMRDHVDLSMARLDLIERRWSAALSTLQRLKEPNGFPRNHLNPTALAIEALFAQLQLGDTAAVISGAAQVDLDQLDALDPDERAVGLSIWARIAEHPAMAGHVRSDPDRLAKAWADYDNYESQLRHALEPWLTH